MLAIEKLIIKGFKAFPGDFELNFDGKHLLMYGENGSGKSSIYYALHCLYQSPLKFDAGKKYFNQLDDSGNENNQHLLNLDTLRVDAGIDLVFEAPHPFIYTVDKDGYGTKLVGGGMPLPGSVEGVFINHNFISNFFDFRNSEHINLFPVFRKDILPYCYMAHNHCLGWVYEKIISNVQKTGNRVSSQHITNINTFNSELFDLIENMNLEISDIFNQHFKEKEHKELRIKLYYRDPDGLILNGYQLKYDKLRYITYDNGVYLEKQNTYKSHNEPFIRLDIEERQDDGTYKPIPKPQTYFNEAKLTAIALSIRFSLLDLVSAPNGRFMALDDMLISLDMSNRTKVIDFLLSISDKYKIYLFTHDRTFFERTRRSIVKYYNQSNQKASDWNFIELHNDIDEPLENPILLPAATHIAKANEYFAEFDYPACANSLRKEIESILKETLSNDVLKNNDGSDKLNLQGSIDALMSIFKELSLDMELIKIIDESLCALLNPLSHNDDSCVFRSELKTVLKTLPKFREYMTTLKLKIFCYVGSVLHLTFVESPNITQVYNIKLNKCLYSYSVAGDVMTNINDIKCNSISSRTLKSGGNWTENKNKHYKGSLEDICKAVHEFKEVEYNNDYIEFYSNSKGDKLTELFNN